MIRWFGIRGFVIAAMFAASIARAPFGILDLYQAPELLGFQLSLIKNAVVELSESRFIQIAKESGGREYVYVAKGQSLKRAVHNEQQELLAKLKPLLRSKALARDKLLQHFPEREQTNVLHQLAKLVLSGELHSETRGGGHARYYSLPR